MSRNVTSDVVGEVQYILRDVPDSMEKDWAIQAAQWLRTADIREQRVGWGVRQIISDLYPMSLRREAKAKLANDAQD